MTNKIYFPPENLQSDLCKYLFVYAATKLTSNKNLDQSFLSTYKSLMESPTKIIQTFPKDKNKKILEMRKKKVFNDDYFYQTKQYDKETELFCFLRHLRNIISHGQLREYDNHTNPRDYRNLKHATLKMIPPSGYDGTKYWYNGEKYVYHSYSDPDDRPRVYETIRPSDRKILEKYGGRPSVDMYPVWCKEGKELVVSSDKKTAKCK